MAIYFKYFILFSRSGDVVVVTTESELNRNDVSPYYWLPCSLISGILTIYTLVYASIYTSGFESTCKQYREALLKEIQGVGNIVPVIKGRLSCSAIFDFMDYLVESIRYERRRYGRINSAICFYFTLIFSWLAVIALLLITVINIVQMRRTRPVRI